MSNCALSISQARQAQEAAKLLSNNRAEAAQSIAQTLVSQTPHSADAHHLLALCLAANGNIHESIVSFDQALALLPNQPMFLENYAQCLRKNGRFHQALARRKQLVEISANVKNLIALGKAALDAQDAETAVQAFARAQQLDAQNLSAIAGLASAWHKLGEYSKAERCWRQVLLAEPNASNYSSLAYVQRISGRLAQSIVSYQNALALEPDRLDIADGLTGALIDDLQISKALNNAGDLVKKFPDAAMAHSTLASLRFEYQRHSDNVDAGDSFEAAIKNAPGNRDLKLARLHYLLETKQSARALESIHSLRRESDTPMLWVFEANALEQLGENALAAPFYERADQHFGDFDIAFLNAYTRHLLKRGDVELAALKTERAILIDPGYQESWAYQATIWRLLGDARETWLCDYDRLIAMMPLSPPANLDLSKLQQCLESLHVAQHEPMTQSVRGGSQTPGNLLGRELDPIRELRDALLNTACEWIRQLPNDSRHPFLKRKSQTLSFSGSWSVRLWKSGKHANHFHNQGWISSAFYVQLPENVRNTSTSAGAIQFGEPPVELGLKLPPVKTLRPQEGHLALFPSYMWHGTVPFSDESARLTVAFDALPIPAHLLKL
jgi:tetratricopeptide (TPR) repeat protein